MDANLDNGGIRRPGGLAVWRLVCRPTERSPVQITLKPLGYIFEEMG